jgi:hypothetical protein
MLGELRVFATVHFKDNYSLLVPFEGGRDAC